MDFQSAELSFPFKNFLVPLHQILPLRRDQFCWSRVQFPFVVVALFLLVVTVNDRQCSDLCQQRRESPGPMAGNCRRQGTPPRVYFWALRRVSHWSLFCRAKPMSLERSLKITMSRTRLQKTGTSLIIKRTYPGREGQQSRTCWVGYSTLLNHIHREIHPIMGQQLKLSNSNVRTETKTT